jgi:hypothetical protein
MTPKKLSRRGFLKVAAIGGGVVVVGGIPRQVHNNPTTPVKNQTGQVARNYSPHPKYFPINRRSSEIAIITQMFKILSGNSDDFNCLLCKPRRCAGEESQMPHFKSFPCTATNVIPQSVSNYGRAATFCTASSILNMFDFKNITIGGFARSRQRLLGHTWQLPEPDRR